MPQSFSRRRWLLATSIACMTRLSSADEGADREKQEAKTKVAANDPRRSKLGRPNPTRTIPNRVVRLKPTEPKLERTVVTAITADPRGELLAVAGDDYAIRILNSATMAVLQVLSGHKDLIRTLAFSPDGNRLISAGNEGRLILWDRDADFEAIQTLPNAPPLACVRFSPRGKEIAAVGFDSKVYLINKTKSDSPRLECDCKDLRAVAYRRNQSRNRSGGLLAVAGRSGHLHLFDPTSYQSLHESEIHDARINALEFVLDTDDVVSVSDDGWVKRFDTRVNRLIRQTQVTSGKLFAVAVLDDQRVAVAGSDNVIRIVDMESETVVQPLVGHIGSVSTLAAQYGTLFSGGFDATLRRWDVKGLGMSDDRIAERNPKLDR